jgi:hypothetical protein
MNSNIHKCRSQSIADGFRFSGIFGNLNQVMPVLLLHKWKTGEKQTGRALPLSRQYAPFSGTPKSPYPVKRRQNFIECRRIDFFKEAIPGATGLAATATAIFCHCSACSSLEIASKIYRCRLLGNRLALFPCFAKIGLVGYFSLQFSALVRRWGTHETKTAPTSYFVAVFCRIFWKRRLVSQRNIYVVPTQPKRLYVKDFQAGAIHQMYGLAHKRLILTCPPQLERRSERLDIHNCYALLK